MSISLSSFISSDQFIVKHPRVALTNSKDTLPPKSRPLASSPVYPLPNNIGEIGSYPYTPGDETPVGDERTGTTNYAIEYLVWVSNEGANGKIADGDIEVSFARNSNWQTKFEFNQILNRWTLVTEDLGEIANAPRLEISDSRINDFNNRPVDFSLSIDGFVFTVSAVTNEAAFTNPSVGTVQFAIAEKTFNFNTSDLATYGGKIVSYSENEDGTSTVDSSGSSSIERNIELTFTANPNTDKKDLSLNYSISDELLGIDLSSTQRLDLSFVPIGSISLRYDPVPEGYTTPLIESRDYVIDEGDPAILFCSVSENEVILSDFTINPQNSGDPDSSRNIYDSLALDHQDVVPNTMILTQTGHGVLTEDVDYLIDLGSGIVHLSYGLTEEILMGNLFIEDPQFISTNFSLYINDVEIDSYLLVPQTGWITTDSPLFEGDIPTVDYVTNETGMTGTSITGEYIKTPSVEIPSINRIARLITSDSPASGGETSFTVQHPPVHLTQVSVDLGSTILFADGDRTSDYVSGVLIKLNSDIYQITTSTYDVETDKTSIEIGSPTRLSYINPTVYYTKQSVNWEAVSANHNNTPIGVTTLTLLNEAANAFRYYPGILIRCNEDIYSIKGAETSGTNLIVSLTSKLANPISVSNLIEITTVPIPTEGNDTLLSFYTPILEIPDKYDEDGALLSLDNRFPGLGGLSVKITRNGSELDFGIDYEIEASGRIVFRDPLSSSDDNITLKYVPFRKSAQEDELIGTYTYYSNAPTGVSLYGTMNYQVPDTFYFRVVNNTTQATVFQEYLLELIKQKSGQVSVGSSPTLTQSNSNHTSGIATPIGDVGELYDNDIIAQRIFDFLTVRIGYLESEKMELSGEIPGGYGGFLTDDDLAESARSTGRLFPVNESTLLAIFKKGPQIALPSRPYRLPVLFGLSTEDDFSRLVLDSAYPKLPIVTFPSFPPQGQIYKGANQEPNAFGILGIYSTSYAASAPSTFIEHWYPYFLDYTYVNSITSDVYTTYTVSPATVDTDVLDVNQDTGDPSTSTAVFPPEETELSVIDFLGFNPATVPLPTYVSVAPRDKTKVPGSYEGASIGALQTMDTAIEASTLKGTSHRETPGDATSYPDFLGWVYRDKNEYDLLKTGTLSEMTLLQNEWLDTSRPNSLSALTDNAKQQLLVLNLEYESLLRQQTVLTNLIAQIDPTPTADPELTTVTQAQTALTKVQEALTDVSNALTNIQSWYDTVIVSQAGVATDTQIRNRWTFITGVDVSSVSPPTSLPTTPVTMDNRIDQVEDRISFIVTRLGQINNNLGFDNTVEPDFSSVSTSEDLYTQRFTYLDLRVNRQSGTLFKALAGHAQYVRDVAESSTLLNLLSLLGV